MISEVDLRDWDKVDFKPFKHGASGAAPLVPYPYLLDFIQQVEQLKAKQFRGIQPRVPALLRKREE
jgi:hypothetical protein